MSDYARQDDFSAKTGTAILGADVDAEFDAVLTAVNSKVDESREGAANGIATLGAGALIPVGISGAATSGGGQVPEATATALGAVELATSVEATDLTDPSRVITPQTLNSVIEAMPGVGLTEAAGVLTVDLNELTTETSITTSDFIAMVDVTDSGSGKITLANLETKLQSDLLHDSFSDFVADEHVAHSSISVIAGAGMTGGGTINGNVTLNVIAGGTAATNPISVAADAITFDASSLTTIAGNALAATDTFLVWDADAAAVKGIQLQQAGLIVNTVTATTAKTFVDADMNQVWVYDNASDATAWVLNTGVGETGDFIILVQKGAGSVDWTGGNAAISEANTFTHTRVASSVVVLLCIAADTWVAYGSTAAS